MTTPRGEIENCIRQRSDALLQVAVRRFCYIGETVVNHARNLPSPNAAKLLENSKRVPPHQPNYIDWTANLRSSIGYKVAVDGQIVSTSGFQQVGQGSEGSKGGQKLADEIIAQHPRGIVLVVVAGMTYAKYVTSRGYDVIDSAEVLTDKMINEFVNKLRQQQ